MAKSSFAVFELLLDVPLDIASSSGKISSQARVAARNRVAKPFDDPEMFKTHIGKVMPSADGKYVEVHVLAEPDSTEENMAGLMTAISETLKKLGKVQRWKTDRHKAQLKIDSAIKDANKQAAEGLMHGKDVSKNLSLLEKVYGESIAEGSLEEKKKRGDMMLSLLHSGQLSSAASSSKRLKQGHENLSQSDDAVQ